MRGIKSDRMWPGSGPETASHIARSVAGSAAGDLASIFGTGWGRPWCQFQSSLTGRGDMWAPYILAKALAGHGPGAGVVPRLKRERAVRKAALSRLDERPIAADHRRTIAVEPVAALNKVILVDGAVTAGAAPMGAAEKMRGAFPDVEVAAFAAMRTARFHNFKKPEIPRWRP